MCGRFAFTKKAESTKSRFHLSKIDKDFQMSYNIAPGQKVPVILNKSPDALSMIQWGLIPFWAKDKKIGYKMINARSETVTEKPSFRGPVRKQRCLILADTFYEWKKSEAKKSPYRIFLENEELFAMAGIWDTWQGLTTCSILTTESHAWMARIHHRMPVILPPEQESFWLSDASSMEKILAVLQPYHSDKMKAYEISPLVNSPKINNSQILQPL